MVVFSGSSYLILNVVVCRQLLAEIATLREVHEDLERQQRLATPRRSQVDEVDGEQPAVLELREKLRQTEEQLATAQKYAGEGHKPLPGGGGDIKAIVRPTSKVK